MDKIISAGKISPLAKELKSKNKKIVLVGGCFDILHLGHIIFLEKAKKTGDILLVLLESDQKIKELKGVDRPVHSQTERAKILSAISFVDYIILLPFMTKKSQYNDLVKKIMPDIIAATRAAEGNDYKKRTANLTGAKLVFVTRVIGQYSTTGILTRKSSL